jgi:hypothetical protein
MSLLVGLPDSSGGGVKEFSSADINPPWLSVLMYNLGDEQYTFGGCSSET